MKSVEWSPRALAELHGYLDWLAERNEDAALRIGEEIDAWVLRIAARPGIGRASRWDGLLVHSRPRRSKLIVYQVLEDRIWIAAFRDARQDDRGLEPQTRN